MFGSRMGGASPHGTWRQSFDMTQSNKEKTVAPFGDNGFDLVVEYSTTQNAHPVGVRRAVLKTHPSEEYGVHPRIYSNHLAG